MNENIFTLFNEAGDEQTYEMLFTFVSEETEKSYMVYRDHTKDKDDKKRVHVSIYDPSRLDKKIYPIETQKELDLAETILNSIHKKMKEENE